MIGKLPPGELAQERLGCRAGIGFGCPPHLPDRNLAPMQVWGKARDAVLAGPVPIGAVPPDALFEEMLELRHGASLPRGPGSAQSPGPVGLAGLQTPILQGIAGRRFRGGDGRWGNRQRELWRHQAAHRLPERGEDPERLPRLGFRDPWLDQQRSVQAFNPDTGAGQRGFDRGVARNLEGFIAPIPEHSPGRNLCGERGEYSQSRPAAQHQRYSQTAQRGVQPYQTAMQPPAGCAADRPPGSVLVVQNEDRDDRPSMFGCGGQRRIVR